MVDRIETVKVQDPTVATNQPVAYGVLEGPEEVTWQQIPANNVSNTSLSINVTAPAMQLIDRRIYVQMVVNFQITGTVPGGNVPLLNLGTSDGLRAYPIIAVTDTLTMKQASTSITIGNSNVIWPSILRYQNDTMQRNLDGSIEPCQFDSYPEYADGIGENRNPLANYGTNTAEMTRGSFNGFFTDLVNPAPSSPGTVTASFNVVLTSPLYLPPYVFHRKSTGLGFYDISTYNLTMTFRNLARMWCRYNVPGGSVVNTSGIVPSIVSAQLLMRQLKPNVLTKIPQILNYPYFAISNYQSDIFPSLAAGASQSYNSQIIQVSGIPRRLYIWAARTQATQDATTTDTFAAINQITLLWNGKPTLSTASTVDLYEMGVQNGLTDVSWPQWSLYTGSLICVDLAKDLGLRMDEAPGLQGKQQVQVQMNITNLHAETAFFALNIVAVQEGVAVLKSDFMTLYENVLTAKDVLGVRARGDATALFKRSEQIYGGDFFSSLLSGLKKGVGFVSNVAKQALPIASLIPGVGQYAQLAAQALPYADAFAGSGVSGGRRRTFRRPMGAGVSGGRRRITGVRSAGRAGMSGRGLAEEDEEVRHDPSPSLINSHSADDRAARKERAHAAREEQQYRAMASQQARDQQTIQAGNSKRQNALLAAQIRAEERARLEAERQADEDEEYELQLRAEREGRPDRAAEDYSEDDGQDDGQESEYAEEEAENPEYSVDEYVDSITG